MTTQADLPPSAFSAKRPGLQLVWDASSLSTYQFCPYLYKQTMVASPEDGLVWGGRGQIDLEFGGLVASGCEVYKKARIAGDDQETAIVTAVRWALEATWNDGDPWGGQYEDQWHCTGMHWVPYTEDLNPKWKVRRVADGIHSEAHVPVPYKNRKGNRAKCPYSHKGMWFPGDRPQVCGECGADTESVRQFVAPHASKHRLNLIRVLIWWGLSQPEDLTTGLVPYVWPDGTPAVEMFLAAPLPFASLDGERYVLTGLIDDIGVLGAEKFIVDQKTTTKSLDAKFFRGYSPHLGLDTYDLLVSVALPNLGVSGVIVDAIQVSADGVRTDKHPYYKTDEMRQEHLDTIESTIKDAEHSAVTGRYEMRKRNCWLCQMNSICSLPPEEREGARRAVLERRIPWTPLTKRD